MNTSPEQEAHPDRLRVLIVPSWYPQPSSPHHGLFIQQQAEALSLACDVAVLHVGLGGATPRVVIGREGSLTVARTAVQLPHEPKTRFQHLRVLYGLTLAYRSACLRGFEALSTEWGTPDIVHGHASIPGALGSQVIARRARVPYVVTEHQAEFLLESPGFSSAGGRLVPRLTRNAMLGASAMIAVSTHLAEALAAGGYSLRPVVVPNIVPDVERPPLPTPAQPPRILHVSLLRSYEKNIPMLLEAVRMVDERGHQFLLRFVGDGPDGHALESLAGDMGLLGRCVEFVGAKSPAQVYSGFASSSFSVVSSRYETFCMAAAESLAAGRPVVCTRCGGPEDFIDESVGLLVDNDDPGAMAEGIVHMLGRYGEFDPRRLRQHARERFSAEVVVQQLLELYRGVIDATE